MDIQWIIMTVAIPSTIRALFAFGFLMRSGQFLLERSQNETRMAARYVYWGLSYVWIGAMVVSALTDILINITIMTVLFGDLPWGWNETFSYRVGRYVYAGQYRDTIRQKIAIPICRILAALEGENHCAYTYGEIECPYPDLKVLLTWKL